MIAFYFDVGGVLIPDQLAPSNALSVFTEMSRHRGFAPDVAYAAYTRLQPSLDLGATSLSELCLAMGIDQQCFESDWLAMHPADKEVLAVIERLRRRGNPVGLATNFCRRLLDLLIQNSGLAGVSICCSSDIRFAKPSTEFFDCAGKIMNSSEIVFVDDRVVNVDAARSCGWSAIHAVNGWLEKFKSAYLGEFCSSPAA
jgi:FMN phosphatase YigB (HAD superfamily)